MFQTLRQITHPNLDIKAFDAQCDAIFAEIPAEVRAAHQNELVFVQPFADTQGGRGYVFGKTLVEVMAAASKQFGRTTPGQLYSLATEDGSLPKSLAEELRDTNTPLSPVATN